MLSTSPAGHTIANTSQDAVGLLGHPGTLLAHVQLAVNQRNVLVSAERVNFLHSS